MGRSQFLAGAALALAVLALPAPSDAGALGGAGLRARHKSLAAQLAQNAFGGPVVLQSQEAGRRVEGDVFAVLDHPYPTVSAALSSPRRWCEILILHLNTKFCGTSADEGQPRIELRVGKKHEQPVHSASELAFAWSPVQGGADYLQVRMDAPDGPYDTRDYLILAEAVPLEGGRTFLHLGYAFSYGSASNLALRLYLATVGRDKVGFTTIGTPYPGQEPQYVGGLRGVTERNTVRYYFAIDAYLGSLSAPPQQQLERRLAAWFDATERFPRQLHEVDRDEYLQMKRNEWQRLLAHR